MTSLSASALPDLFSDVTPTPQTEVSVVCSISYTDDFKLAYDYLRSVLRSDERSDRTLRLTGLCLKLNPANYTVWHFRRRVLGTVHSPSAGGDEEGEGGDEAADDAAVVLPPDALQSELALAASLGGSNPKNYQIWYHRRALLEPLFSRGSEGESGDGRDVMEAAREELEYVASVLDDDGKNYHAWSHRQWIVRTLSTSALWSSELDYAHTLISADPRNNSAWNHRWFVSHRGLRVPLSSEDADQECKYAIGAAEVDPHNESPWRYLIGVVKEQIRTGSGGTGGAGASELLDRLVAEAERVRQTVGDVPCPNADTAIIDLLELRGGDESRDKAAKLASNLGREDDTVRVKYWRMREGKLRSTACA